MVAKNQPRCQKQQVGPVLPPECKAGELQGGCSACFELQAWTTGPRGALSML